MMNTLWLMLGALVIVQSTVALPTNGSRPIFDPLPQDSEDGLWMGTLAEDGSTNWQYLNTTASLGSNLAGHANATALTSRRDTTSDPLSMKKRAPTGAYCDGSPIPEFYFQSVSQGFAQQCGEGLAYSSVITYQYQSVVAYGCNYGNGQTCHGTDVLTFFNNIHSQCGSVTGWWSEDDWKASYGIADVFQGYC